MVNGRIGARQGLLLLLISGLMAWSAPGRAQPLVPRYEVQPCSVDGAPARLECGTLFVPEDHAHPDGRVVQVAVARLKATGPDRQPDPIVYLSGGPGESAIGSAADWSEKPFVRNRDLILVDQRGTGRSEPLCPDASKELARVLAADLTAAEDVAQTREVAARCLESLRDRGVNPALYGSAATASDLEALRRLLGHDQWNLLGVSYGTRLALTALRDAPDGIRSVVLDSPFSPAEDFYRDVLPNFAPALRRLNSDCAADAACHTSVPNVEAELNQLLADLADHPLTLPIDDAEYFPEGSFVVNPQDLRFLVGEQIHFGPTRHLLPLLLRAWRQGETSSLGLLLKILAHGWGSIDLGKHYAVQCYEEMPFSAARLAPSSASGAHSPPPPGQAVAFHDATAAVCADWQLPSAHPRENEPVESTIPTLLLAGELDFRCQTAHARRTAAHLSQGTLVEIPGAGHATSSAPCVDQLVAAFLEHPEATVDSSCLTGRQTPTPLGALQLTSGPIRLLRALRGGHPWGLLWLASALLVLAFAAVLLPIRGLWRWRRRVRAERKTHATQRTGSSAQQRPKTVAHALLALAALVAWAFAVGLARAIGQLLDSDYAVAVLAGIPADPAWLFWLPKATVLLTCGAIAAAALAWRRASWSRLERVHYVLTSISAVAFLAFLGTYDLW